MNLLRQYLLVAVLLFAQRAAGAHAVGHVADKDPGLPSHVCELCLAAHDLGSTLPSAGALPSLPAPGVLPESLDSPSRAALPPPIATQRGPPAF